MTTPTIDNSATKDLKRTITWQFDKAQKLVGVVGMFDDFFNAAVKDPWDEFADGIDISESADAQALTVWGKLLGIPRPTVAVSQSTTRAICDEAYRRILVARFRLLNSSGTTKDYLGFLKYVFGENVKISYADDMALEFEYDENEIPSDTDSYQYDLYLLFGQNPDAIFEYPAGIKSRVQSTGPVVAFEEQVTMVKDGEIYSVATAPDGSEPSVLTGVRVYAILSGDSATIPAGAKTTVDGVKFFTRAAFSLTPEENSFVMVAIGDHPIEAGKISDVTDSEGDAIEGVSSFVNTSRSSLDFAIDTLDNATIVWKRNIP